MKPNNSNKNLYLFSFRYDLPLLDQRFFSFSLYVCAKTAAEYF